MTSSMARAAAENCVYVSVDVALETLARAMLGLVSVHESLTSA